jgi:hypothetical protein
MSEIRKSNGICTQINVVKLPNYVQWTSADKLAAAHHAPEFRQKWPQFGELVKEADPCLYDVVYVEAA